MSITVYLEDGKIIHRFSHKGIMFWLIAMYCLIRYEEMSVVKE